MPELAEVDYYRRVWDAGIGLEVRRVHLHADKRVFRGSDLSVLKTLAGQTLTHSESAGKQMVFRFTEDHWVGIHLGMTGKLSLAEPNFEPGKHDHLVLYQAERTLVFNDARQFGRILVHRGIEAPPWWTSIGPAVTSKEFTLPLMVAFLSRHGRLPIKAALLLQKGFPGIGNWMADEILWRAEIAPKRSAKTLRPVERKRLWKEVRHVAKVALEKIGKDFSDPPRGWLFHERWGSKGVCPHHNTRLQRETIGGRTTAWCAKCQK